MDPATVQRLLKDLRIRPSRRWGQTFLLAEGLARRQVACAVKPGQRVLEIGPGLGILTEALLDVTDQVVAVEVDPRLCKYLRRRFPDLELIQGDAVRVPLPRFDVVVSNLPYGIASPMTFRLLRHSFQVGALMYQDEYAERLVAGPGTKTYSRLTVRVQHLARVDILERVPREKFYPVPQVDSAIVRMEPRPAPYEVADEAVFRTLVDVVFSHRRKKLENSIRAQWSRFADLGCCLEGPVSGLPHGERRPEELSPEELANVANHLAGRKP
jgi:16S rRNA (adenine1518-N6/adenine1519-N6)-dimethyltransferase